MDRGMTLNFTSGLAAALEEAILRATDGTVQLDDDTLRSAAKELLSGDLLVPPGFEILTRGSAFVFRVVDQVIPLSARRPAPGIAEAWTIRPHEFARDQEHRASEQTEDRKWVLVPQPLYSPDTPYEELPERIIRQCCQGKSCGGTDLVKQRRDFVMGGVADTRYLYASSSNDEVHPGFGASTVPELVAQLNDPAWWPNHCALYVFDSYPGDAGFDFTAPDDKLG